MEIVIQAILTGLNDNTLNGLANDISREFEHIKVTTVSRTSNSTISSLKRDTTFQSSFNKHRNQWYSPKLLVLFYEKFRPTNDTKILFILDVDAYSDGLNYVLGEAFPKGGLAIIYLPRIRKEFYGLKPDNELFYERMVKESVHELGHVFGFSHCKNLRCVMHFSNTLNDTDNKERSFCRTCWTKKPLF